MEAVYHSDCVGITRWDDCETEELLTAVRNPIKLTAILFLADLLEERVHVIALGIVEDEREEESPALPLEVALIAGRTKILTC